MPEAKLTLSIPERAWPGAVTRAHPGARVRILAAMAEPDTGVGLAEIRYEDVDALLADVRAHQSIQSVDVLECTDGECLIQFRTATPLLLFAARGSGLPLEMPFEIREGEATWTLTASRESLSSLSDQLSAFGVEFTVEYIQQEIARAEELLTDRQRRLLSEAVARGYYDTPRRCSLTDLADALGLAKSSTSETLHRAEERVMKEFAARNFDEVDSPATAAGETPNTFGREASERGR